MSAGWLKLVKNPAMNRSQRTRPTQFYLCKMHRHQIRQSMSRFAEVPYCHTATNLLLQNNGLNTKLLKKARDGMFCAFVVTMNKKN